MVLPVKKDATHILDTTESIVEKTDEWIADNAHNVYDKSGTIADTIENAVDEVGHKTHNVINKALDATRKKVIDKYVRQTF